MKYKISAGTRHARPSSQPVLLWPPRRRKNDTIVVTVRKKRRTTSVRRCENSGVETLSSPSWSRSGYHDDRRSPADPAPLGVGDATSGRETQNFRVRDARVVKAVAMTFSRQGAKSTRSVPAALKTAEKVQTAGKQNKRSCTKSNAQVWTVGTLIEGVLLETFSRSENFLRRYLQDALLVDAYNQIVRQIVRYFSDDDFVPDRNRSTAENYILVSN